MAETADRTLFIACGALAREIVALKKAYGWDDTVEVTCLPAIWHNYPSRIPAGVKAKIQAGKRKFGRIFVLYGDCGTGGELDKVLAEEGVERIDGPHCYEFFTGSVDFNKLMDDEPGSFFLTDYMVRHFDRLIWQGLALDRHPELRDAYFGNYRRLVYLAQIDDPRLLEKAKVAAERLGLEFMHRRTGYGDLATFMAAKASN
ncbi:DUF1638 domain-containing protein [Dongia soli]|uniref:DUF1638 domain-containing protein n=1 Tax=Dongia soli TaxID=600628 RepID=A0ABU5ED60_9PROT|nr:DUF1638 domain-containing protein [Dongia soli]MDY0883984.1 DUF1638 domain-containing protein [Dongia soli]